MAKRKRGRGLDQTLINLPRIKKRLAFCIRKIDGDFEESQYNFLSERIRKDVDTLLEYAQTPEEKLKLTQTIFKMGRFYMWKPWKVGTLSDEQGREYIMGKMIQAEQDQYKYANVIEERRRVAENKRAALDTLGATKLFQKQPPTGLSIKIPVNNESRELREYKDARKRVVIAKGKVERYRKMVEGKEKRYKADDHNKLKYEEWKNTYSAWKRAQAEFHAANRDLPLKKKAYEDSKQPKAPRARAFLKRKRV